MRRLGLFALALLMVGGSMTALSLRAPETTRATSAEAVPVAPEAIRVPPSPLYGVTIDNAGYAGAAKVAKHKAALDALPHMPTTRLVFDPGTKPVDYQREIDGIRPVSYVLGQLVDSSAMKNTTLAQYQAKARAFVDYYGDRIDIYEVGNEVNGNWLGPYGDVSKKIYDGYSIVNDAGLPSMLTLWYNPGCKGSASELGPLDFSRQYVPLNMRQGLDYVTISYFETQCNNYRPSTAVLTNFFNQLRNLYPNAKLGFGEVGLPRPVTSATLSKAKSIANYYYGLSIPVAGYIGGYFWWYGAQDLCCPHTDPAAAPMFTTVAAAMQ